MLYSDASLDVLELITRAYQQEQSKTLWVMELAQLDN